MSFYHFARNLATVFLSLLYKVQLEGQEHIPTDRGFVLCSNHITNCDPIFVAGRIKLRCSFMAKAELFAFKPFGVIFRHLGAFPVARGKGDTAAIDTAVQIVKSGGALVIFPEGTRSKTGSLLKLKSGAVLIASQSGGDLLPCAVKKGKRSLWRRIIYVHFGEIIPNASLGIDGKSPAAIKGANRLLTARLTGLLEEQYD